MTMPRPPHVPAGNECLLALVFDYPLTLQLLSNLMEYP